MTIGVPEINLDTWGLKYVKKKKQSHEVTEGEMGKIGYAKPISETIGQAPSSEGAKRIGDTGSKSPAETKPDQFMRDDEAATSNPRTRQQDQVPDTNTSVTSRGGKIGERWQQHEHQQDKHRIGGQKKETSRTTGRQEGATDTPTKTGQALDAKGQVKHGKTHTGTEGRNLGDPSTDPKSSGGHKIKPAKQGESLSPSAKPSKNIQRAALDLSIIKCKLLKMKTKKKDFIEEGRPTRPAYRKDDDDEKEGKEKSNEIVEKAIELINEAYGEMNKSNPVIVSDPKGKPFCSNCGRDHGKEDAKALEGTDDQQQRMVSGTRGGNKPSCPSCGHRPAKKAKDDYCTHCGSKKEHLDSEGKHTPQIEEGEGHDVPEVDRDSKGYAHRTGFEEGEGKKKAEDIEAEAGVNLKDVIVDLKETKKEGADGGTSTTSSEGGFNHVYSDVHEAKRQKQNQ